MSEIIKSISYDQQEIIKNILELHVPDKKIEMDVTYSKGMFYKNAPYPEPDYKHDIHPLSAEVEYARAEELPYANNKIKSIMFDPPFLVGHHGDKSTGKITKRFYEYRTIEELWEWYDKCFKEFDRVIIPGGVLIVKCQDTISDHKQYWSHIHIMDSAEAYGLHCKDLFVLLAKNRMIRANQKKQYHARKFHSYFLVFQKGA